MAGKRTTHINIRLSEAEHAGITCRAKTAGMGVSEYVRRRSLSDHDGPTVVADVETLQAIYRLTRRTGGNLNQIARELNTRHRPDQIEEEIHDALSSARQASDDISAFIQAARDSVSCTR